MESRTIWLLSWSDWLMQLCCRLSPHEPGSSHERECNQAVASASTKQVQAVNERECNQAVASWPIHIFNIISFSFKAHQSANAANRPPRQSSSYSSDRQAPFQDSLRSGPHLTCRNIAKLSWLQPQNVQRRHWELNLCMGPLVMS